MSEEDSELKDLVYQILENRGVIKAMRAKLRASVFLTLEDQNNENKLPMDDQLLKEFLQTSDGKLAFGLAGELLQRFNLEYTLSVLQAEAGLDTLPDRAAVAREFLLNSASPGDAKRPLLSELIAQLKSHSGSLRQKNAGSELNGDAHHLIPEDLSISQVDDARQKFRKYDKDHNGLIDKDELRHLFCDMFPNFNSNMLERYVSDEFRSTDRNLSNGIDFDEFVTLYKRLFIQCRSVVAMDVVSLTAGQGASSSAPDADPGTAVPPSSTNSNHHHQKHEQVTTAGRKELPAATEVVGGTGSGHQPTGSRSSPTMSVEEGGDGDPFFDDPIPLSDNSNSLGIDKKFGAASNSSRAPASTAAGSKPAPSSSTELPAPSSNASLRDLPSLGPGGGSGSAKYGRGAQSSAFSRKLAGLGLDDGDNGDYADDFDESGRSSPRKALSAQSMDSSSKEGKPQGQLQMQAKSAPAEDGSTDGEEEHGANHIDEEDEEIDEDLDIEEEEDVPNTHSAADDQTIESDHSLGVDYSEKPVFKVVRR